MTNSEKRRSYTLRFTDLFDGKLNDRSRSYVETYDVMESKMKDDGKGNDVFIVPAFWRCIHSLVAAKRSFSILFRTFGTDTDDVVSAFNAFCTEYGYDGTRRDAPNLLIDDEHIGCIHRNVWGGHTLILGLKRRNPMDRSKGIKEKTREQLMTTDRMKWYYEQQIQDQSIRIESAAPRIYEMLKSESMSHRTMMLSDDYVWWSVRGEQSEDGKVLLMDTADKGIHQIFFDDNLEFDRAGIVDVRDLKGSLGKQCISDSKYGELTKKHLLKVEPLNVILNDDYFIENIIRFEEAL